MIWVVVALVVVVVVMAVAVLVARGADELGRLERLVALDAALGRTATPAPRGDADGDDHTADDEGRRPVGDGERDHQADSQSGQATFSAALR